MAYDVKLTVAAKPRSVVHWLHLIEARTPEEAVTIAAKRWGAEWRGNLPTPEMRVAVYEAGRGEVLSRSFRFDSHPVPAKH